MAGVRADRAQGGMGNQVLDWPAIARREAVELAAGVAGEQICASLGAPPGQGRRKVYPEAAGKLGEAEAARRRRCRAKLGRLSGRRCDYFLGLEIFVLLGGLPGADSGVRRFGGGRWRRRPDARRARELFRRPSRGADVRHRHAALAPARFRLRCQRCRPLRPPAWPLPT